MTPVPVRAPAASLFLALAVAVPAQAELAPTSSATVSISVSVRAKYALGSGGAALPGTPGMRSSSLCIATNGSATPLPVLLVRPLADRTEPGRSLEEVEQLAWCELGKGGVTRTVDGPSDRLPSLLLIRPE